MLCWKHYLKVFAAKHSFADMKECNLKKITKNKGLFAKNAERCFLGSVFLFLVVLLFFFVCLSFFGKALKGHFPAILDFFYFVPQKACL